MRLAEAPQAIERVDASLDEDADTESDGPPEAELQPGA